MHAYLCMLHRVGDGLKQDELQLAPGPLDAGSLLYACDALAGLGRALLFVTI